MAPERIDLTVLVDKLITLIIYLQQARDQEAYGSFEFMGLYHAGVREAYKGVEDYMPADPERAEDSATFEKIPSQDLKALRYALNQTCLELKLDVDDEIISPDLYETTVAQTGYGGVLILLRDAADPFISKDVPDLKQLAVELKALEITLLKGRYNERFPYVPRSPRKEISEAVIRIRYCIPKSIANKDKLSPLVSLITEIDEEYRLGRDGVKDCECLNCAGYVLRLRQLKKSLQLPEEVEAWPCHVLAYRTSFQTPEPWPEEPDQPIDSTGAKWSPPAYPPGVLGGIESHPFRMIDLGVLTSMQRTEFQICLEAWGWDSEYNGNYSCVLWTKDLPNPGNTTESPVPFLAGKHDRKCFALRLADGDCRAAVEEKWNYEEYADMWQKIAMIAEAIRNESDPVQALPVTTVTTETEAAVPATTKPNGVAVGDNNTNEVDQQNTSRPSKDGRTPDERNVAVREYIGVNAKGRRTKITHGEIAKALGASNRSVKDTTARKSYQEQWSSRYGKARSMDGKGRRPAAINLKTYDDQSLTNAMEMLDPEARNDAAGDHDFNPAGCPKIQQTSGTTGVNFAREYDFDDDIDRRGKQAEIERLAEEQIRESENQYKDPAPHDHL